jgi:hypothetical protein
MEEIFFYCFSAKAFKLAKGSLPGERTKISGVVELESLYIKPKSKGGGSTNFCDSWEIMKS